MDEMSERTTMGGKPVFTVPARTIINFKSGFGHKLLCDGMTFTTGSACVYSCAFCYVESMQKKQQQWFKDHSVVYLPEGHMGVVIRNENPVAIALKQILSKPEEYRRSPQVIYSSPKVDVAGNMELVRETVEICKVILQYTSWHIRLLSKSNLLPKIAQALEVFVPEQPLAGSAKGRIIYGVSTGTLDDKLAQAFEEGCPLVSKRIQSLHWLQDNGFRTFGMVCPSLPQGDDAESYGPWAKNMAEMIRSDRCESVWTEVLNLRGESFTRTVKALWDGGFGSVAMLLERVTSDKTQWEQYARNTFLAHAKVYSNQISPDGSPKLRHLQYATASVLPWWKEQVKNGAILL